jgi:hypothetical protein
MFRGPTIFIPTSARLHGKEPIYVCRVITSAEGDTCGKPFYEGEERTRDFHVANCAKQNHDAIMAFRNRSHPEIMRPWDPELEKWISDNRTAILEDRKSI